MQQAAGLKVRPSWRVDAHGVVMTLDQLPLGASAKVLKLGGSSAVRRRLMEMGITPAATVEAVRRAPMGDPLDVKIRGYHLSLRKEEAAAVEIAPA